MILTQDEKDALIMMAKCTAVDLAVKDILDERNGCLECDNKAKYYMIVMLVNTLLCGTCKEVDENDLYEKLYGLIDGCEVPEEEDPQFIDFPQRTISARLLPQDLVILSQENFAPLLQENGNYLLV